MRRQHRLTDEQPLRLDAMIQEDVLRRPIGDPPLHRAQLQRIIERASLPNVTVRVMPESVGHHDGLLGTFTVLSFPDKEDKDIAYIEHALGAQHIEDPDLVRTATLRLDYLAGLALSPTASIEFIERLVSDV